MILDHAEVFVRRFVVLSDRQADAVALWIAHTHAMDAFDTTPYLAITSPVMRSGKSRLLEVLELVACEPLPAANLSDAVLFRIIGKREETDPTRTLLLDEGDAIFKAREREELRGLLNAGWRRGGKAHRMGGANMRTLETYDVFGPKAFAGIGAYLPGTLADRSIVIQLERRTRAERVDRFRRREVTPEAEELRDRLADWLEPQMDELRAARPDLPEELDDRAWDYWEPLLAIADLAGADWPERARLAAVELSGGEAREDEALSIRLLSDVRDVFDVTGAQALKTSVLISELGGIEESPWGDWYGKAITPQGLSKLLRQYRIKTMAVWVDGTTVRGYKRAQFTEAWQRYLPRDGVRGSRTVRNESPCDAGPNAPNAPNAGTGDGLPMEGYWLARDGRWRAVAQEPPHRPGEVLETAAQPPGDNGLREVDELERRLF